MSALPHRSFYYSQLTESQFFLESTVATDYYYNNSSQVLSASSNENGAQIKTGEKDRIWFKWDSR